MTGTDARRELAVAIGCCLLGAAAVLLAGEAAWAQYAYTLDAFPVIGGELDGRQVAPVAVALGLLALAGAVALLATKGRPRRFLGLLLVLTGALVVLDSIRAYGRFDTLAAAAAPAGTAASAGPTWWPWVAAAGGIAIAAAGVLAATRGARWAAMSRRYEPPGADRATTLGASTADPDPDAAWRALDRGEDPTLRG